MVSLDSTTRQDVFAVRLLDHASILGFLVFFGSIFVGLATFWPLVRWRSYFEYEVMGNMENNDNL